MFQQADVIKNSKWTDGAVVWFGASMYGEMTPQYVFLICLIAAYVAGEWQHSFVRQDVGSGKGNIMSAESQSEPGGSREGRRLPAHRIHYHTIHIRVPGLWVNQGVCILCYQLPR